MFEGYFFSVVLFIGIVFYAGLLLFFEDLIIRELFGLKTFDKEKEDSFNKTD